jgi:6-phosphogluconolactonase
MGDYDLQRFQSPEELAQAAARDFIALTNRVSGRFCVALSGGRIAATFFTAAKDLALRQNANFRSVEFFWGDERCVPPDHPESNFRLAREYLLQPLGIAEAQIHRIRGEKKPEEAAKEAEADLRSTAPATPIGQPVLDLVLLGLGENGHVASLFPEEPDTMIDDPAVFRPVQATKPPPSRITLGYRAIAAAKQVWVLASGPGKESAFKESLSPTGKTPLARVVRLRNGTRVMTDIAAP